MSSCLCFICNNIANIDTNEEICDKFRELIGTNLCTDSNLCSLCVHMLNKFWDFKSVCLNRCLKYPALFSEKGILKLQTTEAKINVVCTENICSQNNKSINFIDNNDKFDDDYDIFNDNVDVNKLYENDDFNKNNELHEISILNDHQLRNEDEEISNEDIDCDLLNENNHLNVEDNDEQNNEYDNHDDNYNDVTNILDHNNAEQVTNENKKGKTSKTKKEKKEFDKVILSLEEQKADLERNRKEKKYIEAEFKCYNCALGFLFKDTYQAHMMRHEESNGEYRCDTCTLRFATPAVLRSHIALHAERHVCRRCKATLRPRARVAHAVQCYGKPTEVAACDKCPRLFKDSRGLQQHLKRFHQTKASTRTYSCSVCGKSYANQAAVRTHMITHIHRKFQCSQCPATFSSPYTLATHTRRHTAPAHSQYCAPCGQAFRDRKGLLAHRRHAKHHQEHSFECPICFRPYANQRCLNHHIEAVHSTNKDYACARCSARYSTEKALRRHARGHEGRQEGGKAVCHLCGRGFKGNNKLNRHLREVCEKDKLEEELSAYYAQEDV